MGRFPISGGSIDATVEAGNREASHFSGRLEYTLLVWAARASFGRCHETGTQTADDLFRDLASAAWVDLRVDRPSDSAKLGTGAVLIYHADYRGSQPHAPT